MPTPYHFVSMLALLSIPSQAPGPTFTTEIDLRFSVEMLITQDADGDGLPEEVQVGGAVLDEGQEVGAFSGSFVGPEFVPLPEELAANAFGIPVGTVMPAWNGPVSYEFSGGSIVTQELAFIFPDEAGKLVVLSTADVTGGSGAFRSVLGGEIVTPDGYDGIGSLLGELLSSRPLRERGDLN